MRFSKVIAASAFLLGLLNAPAFAQQDAGTATVYTIDGDETILRVYVGRAGVLARMGHNHVVHTQSINGQVMLAANAVDSTASFSFPVNSFIVDDQSERDRAGDGFESQPGESAITGTRENMLGENVLNAQSYPEIAIDVSTVSAEQEQWLLNVAINIQGNTFTQEIPATVSVSDSRISVVSRFSLDHEDLGLSPFSALGGSLRVAETLDFELQLSATAQ